MFICTRTLLSLMKLCFPRNVANTANFYGVGSVQVGRVIDRRYNIKQVDDFCVLKHSGRKLLDNTLVEVSLPKRYHSTLALKTSKQQQGMSMQTRYFLTEKEIIPIILERCGVACGASGKSGGFLVSTWCDQSKLKSLARKNFELHYQLSQTLGVDYGHKRVDTLSVSIDEPHIRRKLIHFLQVG